MIALLTGTLFWPAAIPRATPTRFARSYRNPSGLLRRRAISNSIQLPVSGTSNMSGSKKAFSRRNRSPSFWPRPIRIRNGGERFFSGFLPAGGLGVLALLKRGTTNFLGGTLDLPQKKKAGKI